jgi:hypothetical protein
MLVIKEGGPTFRHFIASSSEILDTADQGIDLAGSQLGPWALLALILRILQHTREYLNPTQVFHSAEGPLGPWTPIAASPVKNGGCSRAPRNAGRPFEFEGALYRLGQDCSRCLKSPTSFHPLLSLTPTSQICV